MRIRKNWMMATAMFIGLCMSLALCIAPAVASADRASIQAGWQLA